MPFDPKTNKFPYPLETDHHYLEVKKNDGTVFDKNYPYVDESKKFRRKVGFFRFLLKLIAFPVVHVRMNVKVVGRKNLKKYKDVIKGGIISVCNHVHMWDYLSIMRAVRPYETNVLSWAPDISGENGKVIRLSGGIPIPVGDTRALATCFSQVISKVKNGGWLHVYSEGSMWEFYQPIRPFKDGAAYFSLKTGRPILPMAYSYRKNGWIRRVIFKSPASFTLTIGEPIYPDLTVDFKEEQKRLTVLSHDEVCRLAGIDPKENVYPAYFEDSKRIDYYTDTYGVGYKGSW